MNGKDMIYDINGLWYKRQVFCAKYLSLPTSPPMTSVPADAILKKRRCG